jgi:hypothetical protein
MAYGCVIACRLLAGWVLGPGSEEGMRDGTAYCYDAGGAV